MIITLTTDFGLMDPYVGIMKGVILGIAPTVQIVDITHEIASYDIDEAAFLISSATSYFPPRSVHLIVVDPGVGSLRRPIATTIDGQTYVAPDNGVLSFVLRGDTTLPEVRHITNEKYFRKPVGRTFHGRDIFAPTAAHLATGEPLASVGPTLTDVVLKPFPEPVTKDHKLVARVLHVDRFGNLVTNLRSSHLNDDFRCRIGDVEITRQCQTFSEARAGRSSRCRAAPGSSRS